MTAESTTHPVHLDDAALSELLRTSTVPVLVDFYADWCGPCRLMAPVLDQIARAHAGDVLVVKLDTDRNPATAERFGIRGIPTMILFRDGRELRRQVGAVPAAAVERMLAAAA